MQVLFFFIYLISTPKVFYCTAKKKKTIDLPVPVLSEETVGVQVLERTCVNLVTTDGNNAVTNGVTFFSNRQSN